MQTRLTLENPLKKDSNKQPKANLSENKRKYTLVDLFSGIGGFHNGFLDTDRFDLKLAVDFNKECALFHQVNFPELPFEQMDVSKIDKAFYKKRNISDVDVLIGGPPCQGFSTIGARASSNQEKRLKYDIRNNLIGHFIEQVRILKPKYFLMENVRGLTTYKGGDFFTDVLEEFNSLKGYTVNYKILNAVDYGVPQSRQRTFVFGNRIGYDVNDFPEPDHFENGENGSKYKTVQYAIGDLVGKEHNFPNHAPLVHGEINIQRYKLIPEGGRMPEDKLSPELYRKNFGSTFKRLHREKPSLTMVPGHNAFPVHPILNRSLTVREAARIQTFSDDIIFVGNRQAQCIQVGNAVPPLFAKKWANHILNILDEYAQ
jgi:DNA (cytosine-5)-methyltransferase 1